MKCDNCSCKGESHIASGKPCQDWSLHWCDDQSGLYIAIVCDGHGGERYFRSDVGSKLLCEITKESLCSFAKAIRERNAKSQSPLFKGKPLVQIPTVDECRDSLPRQSAEDSVVTQLLSSIVVHWREAIERHAQGTPISEWERENVRKEYLDDFSRQYNIEKNYGSTIIAYLQTRDYWLAFHLGDGKCIMFDENDECYEPVLWDEKCFLNRTTSICDPAPIEEFRYTYRGDGVFPAAVFLGSDGIDDSYGDGEQLHHFYMNILRLLSTGGVEAVHNELEASLPEISKKGSKDDMSVAFVYDESSVKEHAVNLTKKEIDKLEKSFKKLERAALAKKNMVDEYASVYERKRPSLKAKENNRRDFNACEQLRINLKYAFSEENDLFLQLNSLNNQITALYEFLGNGLKESLKTIYRSSEDHSRIKSFIDGTFGKECDEKANISFQTATIASVNENNKSI